MSAALDMKAPETRGIRLRPLGTTSEESLVSQIEAAAEAGFNLVVIDVFSRGFSAFPSTVCRQFGLPRQRRELRRWDPLAVACRTAIENELAIVAVIDCLDQGHGDLFPGSPFTKSRFSSWRFQSAPRRRFLPGSVAAERVWLCPWQLQVRRFLSEYSTEIADHYPVTGIWLDGLWNEQGHLCHCDACEIGRDLNRSAEADRAEAVVTAKYAELLSDFITTIKSRSRKSRRTLHFYGWRPGASGNTELMESGLFDIQYVPAAEAPVQPDEMHVTHGYVKIDDHAELADKLSLLRQHAPAGWLLELKPEHSVSKSAIDASGFHGARAEANPAESAAYYLKQAGSLLKIPAMDEAAELVRSDAFDLDVLEAALMKAETALQSRKHIAQETGESSLMNASAYLRLAITSST